MWLWFTQTCTHIHTMREICRDREGLFRFYFSQLKYISSCRAACGWQAFLYLVSLADRFLYLCRSCVLSPSTSSLYFSVMIESKEVPTAHQTIEETQQLYFTPQDDHLRWTVATITWWCSCRFLFSAFSCILLLLLPDLLGILHIFLGLQIVSSVIKDGAVFLISFL